MKAIDYVDLVLKEVDGADVASAFIKTDPMMVEVVAAPFKLLMPWLRDHGFLLVPPKLGVVSKFAWVSSDHTVLVTIQPAFGGSVRTNFPEGWPQSITALVTAGWMDLGSKAVARRVAKKRKKNPSGPRPGTFSYWMRKLNGILLRDIDLGTWHLTRQPYREMFESGIKPLAAANAVIDGVSSGEIKRRYKRKKT